MNINELYTLEAHETGAEFQIKDENGKLIDAFITVAGLDSKLFRNAKSEMMRNVITNDGKDAEEIRAKASAAIILNWRGLMNGEDKFTFGAENAEKLCNNAPFIMDQIDTFITNRGNFTKG